jgi:uncharacterized ferredoxin-like protein
MIIDSNEAENEVILDVAKLVVVAARTAPKARGEDKIQTAIITGEDKEKLAKIMEERGSTRDAGNVREASVVVLIGVECGNPNGEWITFRGKLIDLGIALGSAVKIASDLNVDNRIMHSVGVAAAEMGIMNADEIQGIPLSIKGKNIFFDRKS